MNCDYTCKITLQDNSTDHVEIEGFKETFGIYTLMISPITNPDKPHAQFTLGRLKCETFCGSIVRILCITGLNGEKIDMQWKPNCKPQIFYKPCDQNANSNSKTEYILRIRTV